LLYGLGSIDILEGATFGGKKVLRFIEVITKKNRGERQKFKINNLAG
jgi:hypothetical protein